MKTKTRYVTLILGCVLGASCIPEKRVVWSPTGDRAAVVAKDGLYFIDADGNVLEPRLKERVARCAWFPDGQRLAVVREVNHEAWNDVKGHFDPQEAARIEKEWFPSKDPADEEPSGDKKNELWVIQVYRIVEKEVEPGKILAWSREEILQPLVSPNGRLVSAIMEGADPEDETAVLNVVSAEGGPVRTAARNIAYIYGWSPDGRSLAFIRSSNPTANGEDDELTLGIVTTALVAAPDGALLDEWKDVTDHVGVLFTFVMGVHWLPDGRLLFSTVEVTFPATKHDMPRQWTLFLLDPKMPISVTRALGRDFDEPWDSEIPYFEPSPDGKRVLLYGPDGRVTLYEFSTGKAVSLVGDETLPEEEDCFPTWRNNEEVSLVGKFSECGGESNQVALRREGLTKCLSNAWPGELRDDWFDDK